MEANREEQRWSFVLEYYTGHGTRTELCERYGISRVGGRPGPLPPERVVDDRAPADSTGEPAADWAARAGSPRAYAPPKPPECPAHVEVRRVNAAGAFRFLSNAFAGERMALEAIGDGLWSILYY